MHLFFLVVFQLLFFTSLFAQNDGFYDENYLRFDDFVYSDHIKTVQLNRNGFDYSLPAIQLGSNEKLRLNFDDMNVGSMTYNYTFILCNSDWTPADLLPMEYLDGMTEDYFNTNAASFNTTTSYTNYSVLIPSSNLILTKSGNYILKVYPEGDPDNPIFTRRMYVVENKVDIEAQARICSAPQYRNSHQELSVNIKLNHYPMPNVYDNFSMHIQQNGRKDNMIVKTVPTALSSDYLYFNQVNDILFDAGNEFRVFDIRSLKTYSSRISQINYDAKGYHISLLTDGSRYRQEYLKYTDLNGGFAIINWDDPQLSSQIESDYAWITFSLQPDSIMQNGSVYLMGAFTDWNLLNKYKLSYNSAAKLYNASLLLKQGYYDYHYVYVPNNSNRGSVIPLEGNHSETINNYTIFVYYRDQGDFYDKLIGLKTIVSTYD